MNRDGSAVGGVLAALRPAAGREEASLMASETSKGKQRHPGLSRKRFVFVLIGLMLAVSVSSLSETIASTALPTIVGDLGGVEMMQWISTAYILTSTIVMPFYGKASDTFGRKYLLMGRLRCMRWARRYAASPPTWPCSSAAVAYRA